MRANIIPVNGPARPTIGTIPSDQAAAAPKGIPLLTIVWATKAAAIVLVGLYSFVSEYSFE